jgi:hypothetical protein
LGLEEKKETGDTVVFVSDHTVSDDVTAHKKRSEVDKVYPNISGNEHLVKTAEEHVKKTGNQIKNFQVSGHAYGAGVQTKAGKNNSSEHINTVNMTEQQIDRLKTTLTPDARYKAFGCAAGKSEENLQDTADALDVPASGYTNNMLAGDKPVNKNPSTFDVIIAESMGVTYTTNDADDGHWVTKKPPQPQSQPQPDTNDN